MIVDGERHGQARAHQFAGEESVIGNRQNVIFILTDDQGWEELGCLQHAGHQTAHFGKWHLGQSRGGGTSVPDVGEYGFATGACNGTEGPEL